MTTVVHSSWIGIHLFKIKNLSDFHIVFQSSVKQLKVHEFISTESFLCHLQASGCHMNSVWSLYISSKSLGQKNSQTMPWVYVQHNTLHYGSTAKQNVWLEVKHLITFNAKQNCKRKKRARQLVKQVLKSPALRPCLNTHIFISIHMC